MCGYEIPAVNEATRPLAPEEALAMLGSALPRMIAAVAEAKEADGPIFFSKYDIKDGFWRMCSKAGAEWNFAYVLPAAEDDDVEIVVPTSLQMGWTLSQRISVSAPKPEGMLLKPSRQRKLEHSLNIASRRKHSTRMGC